MSRQGSDTYPLTMKQIVTMMRLYRSHELLWNKNNADYSNRPLRNKAYEELVSEMAAGDDFEVRHLKLKLRSYRDMYIRELRGRRTGRAEPPFWFKEMDFLRSHVNINKEEIIMENTFEDVTYLDQESGDDEVTSNVKIEPSVLNEFIVVDNVQAPSLGLDYKIVEEYDHLDSSKAAKKPRLEMKTSEKETVNTDALARIESLQAEILAAIKGQDEDLNDYFGNFSKYVASMLRSLPRSKAYALQPKIIAMITEEHVKLAQEDEIAY